MTYSERHQRQAAEDYALRAKVLHWEAKDLMQMPRDVPSVLGFSNRPRLTAGKSASVVERTAPVCTGRPKSFAQRDHRTAYALQLELGQRAYDELTGTRKRTKAAAKPKPKVLDRSVLEGNRPSPGVVVLSYGQGEALGLGSMSWLADE